MNEIISELVEAGYFRARISTLSDFDKIIGGIAWTMQFLSVDINEDIFYTDTLDLGQKIALTERLVMVMVVIKCPHRIEPHQIVGLDYANLLPAIRWLIKRSSEIRRQHEAFNRLIALRHFHRVTNTTPDRNTWCHLVPIEKLSKGKASLKILDFDVSPLKRQVSFVTLPSLLRHTTRQGRQGHEEVPVEHGEDSGSDATDEEEGGIGTTKSTYKPPLAPPPSTPSSSSSSQPPPRPPPPKPSRLRAGLKPRELTVDERLAVASKEDPKIHQELDEELLATNQKVLNLIKKVDAMPTKMEIDQYQRRYIELQQQMCIASKDLKKLFALFNSLQSVKFYLGKEITLLDSIATNLDLTAHSSTNRHQFLTQLEVIISKIQTVRKDVTAKLEELRKDCYRKSYEYSLLTAHSNA